MTRLISLLWGVVMIVSLPAPASAAFATPCRPAPEAGRIRTVVTTEEFVDQFTRNRVEGPRKVAETNVTADGRHRIHIRYAADSLAEARTRSYPVTVSEYDDKGTLIRETHKADGRTETWIGECHYDDAGRVERYVMRSEAPEYNRLITFEYNSNSRKHRFKTAVASILVTQSLDDHGRVVKEVELDELSTTIRAVRDFRYDGASTEVCSAESGGKSSCRTSIIDQYGNEVETRTPGGVRKTTYEYDSRGNWITKREPTLSARTDTVTRRQIAYW